MTLFANLIAVLFVLLPYHVCRGLYHAGHWTITTAAPVAPP
jgi:hypothetical protein